MPQSDATRAERLGPYFEAQLCLAQRMAQLTGGSLGEMTLRHTNLHRRLGFGVNLPDQDGAPGWKAYVRDLEAAPDLSARVALSQATCAANPPEKIPLAGQAGFGCFACDPPDTDGVVRIHFFNADTDEAGGPLARAKVERRRAELAALTRHVLATHPEARVIRGKSWLYNVEAYRRLFPADYAASRTVWTGSLHLTGTSSWGQIIDSWERVRPDMRDALLANLPALDAERPWLAFPLRVLATEAPIESFAAEYGL
jgi:hypothetical protein